MKDLFHHGALFLKIVSDSDLCELERFTIFGYGFDSHWFGPCSLFLYKR